MANNVVTVTVSGPVGCGKSAVYTEIVVALSAMGLTVEHADPKAWQSELNMGAFMQAHDYLDIYRPTIIMSERVSRDISPMRPAEKGALERAHWKNRQHSLAKDADSVTASTQKAVLSVRFSDGWPVQGSVGIYSDSPILPDGYHDFCAVPQSSPTQQPIAWLNDAYLARGVVDGEAGSEDAGPGYIPVYRRPQPPLMAIDAETSAVTPVFSGCWIPLSEQRPEDGSVVLACVEGGIIFCSEVEHDQFWPDDFPNLPRAGREITHWMPLPLPPAQAGGDKC